MIKLIQINTKIMRKIYFSIFLVFTFIQISAQDMMTPELLVQLGKVSGKGITKDGNNVIFSVSKYSIETNAKTATTFIVPVKGGAVK